MNNKIKGTSLIFSTFCLILLSLNSCRNTENKDKSDAVEQYEVVELTSGKASVFSEFPAAIQGEQVIEIRPKAEGYLEELYVDEGATVHIGQKLFRISNPQYEQELLSAEAGLQTAEADVAAAQMTVSKTQPLVAKEIISSYDLESAQYSLRSKKALLRQAAAALANARVNLGYTVIKSPSNGVIGTIPYKKGSLISSDSTDPLTTLSADKKIYAYFALNEKQLLDFSRNYNGLTLQQKITHLPSVQLVLADGSIYGESGKIETASGLLTTQTGSSNFRAVFPNPENLLKSGASAVVRIPNDIDKAIIIPQSAAFELQDKKLVYVLDKSNMVMSRSIIALPTNDGQSLIISKGLAQGEKVVLNGLGSLKDSVLIKPNMVNAKNISNIKTQ